jgi:mannose-6-phosphate isomerase-like protein (cupin superfamily)
MAAVGTTLRQGDTDTMTFINTTASTGGKFLEVEAVYAPMIAVRPPVHSHPRQDEHFEVLDGELTFEVEGKRRTVVAGDDIDLPRGVLHTVWNAAPEQDVKFRWRTTPALHTEAMYEMLWGMADDGVMGRHGIPRPPLLQGALVMFAYRQEYKLAKPPYPILLTGCALLGTLGRLRGYSAQRKQTVAS